MTDEMVAWLRVQLDEDETRELAKWTLGDYSGKPCPVCDAPVESVSLNVPIELGPCRHEVSLAEYKAWAGAEPAGNAQVLRDVEAKRRIIDLCAEHAAAMSDRDYDDQAPYLAVDVMRELASVYAGRPGYREEWRP